jgi:hypothetical protein
MTRPEDAPRHPAVRTCAGALARTTTLVAALIAYIWHTR